MSNAPERIVDRILHHFEQAGRSPVDRFTLLRAATTPGESPSAVHRALRFLILRGEVRRVRDLYIRVSSVRSAA